MSELWNLFECKRCGQCCEEIGLPYDPESAIRIADFLRITVDDLIERYYGELSSDRKSWTSQDHKRTPCPFLEPEGKIKRCKIYQVRPLGCKLYPFDTDFGRGGVDCPGAKIAYEKWEEINISKNGGNEILGHFDLVKIPFDQNHLVGPIAFIKLASHSIKKIEGKEHKCLSPDCVTYKELKCKIDLLKRELDQLSEEGKRFFDEEIKKRKNGARVKHLSNLNKQYLNQTCNIRN